jgi:uncharacterized protein (TIGR00369 family)
MKQIFDSGERQVRSAAQVTALAALAARVRELTEAVVLTDVDPAELGAVTAEVDALTRRLAAVGRAAPPVAEIDEDDLVRQYASPVTGELNPIAPPISIELAAGGVVRTEFRLSAVYEGPPGAVHGGVSAMILDHLCGCAAVANGTPGMTVGLEMSYRRPTPQGVTLSAEARVVRVDGRKTFVEGRITGPDGVPTAEATAVFVRPTAMFVRPAESSWG